ncbi:MAG: DNA polymerase III subunit gamma/tau [Peptoniphilaceae bacterium]
MYQALYRKYRSRTFDELVGQDSITRSLKNQIKNNTISHAYLFSGTRGTGKTSAAKIFARAVNCLDLKDGQPCNKCENCKSILEDRSIDVVEMDAASNNGVDDIRELKDKVIYPPQNLKYKVYIIDEVHMLSKGAFNALLKVLEEPPKHLIFILATTEPEKIPQTILSRTQRFNFKRIEKDIIAQNLKRISELENKSCDDEVYELIANNSDGAMRDALSLLDQCLSYDEDHISYEKAIDILGISSNELIFKLSSSLISFNLEESMQILEEVYKSGKDISILVLDLINQFRNLMIIKTIKNPSDLVYSMEIEKYKNLSEKVDLDRLIKILKILNESLINAKYSRDKRIILEMAIVKIIRLENENSILQRLEKLEDFVKIKTGDVRNLPYIEDKSIENKANEIKISRSFEDEHKDTRVSQSIEDSKRTLAKNNNDFNEEVSKKEKTYSNNLKKEDKSDIIENSLSFSQVKSDWNNILIELKKRNRINIPILLSSGELSDVNNNTIFIKYDSSKSFQYKAISSEENISFIEHFFKNYYNMDIKLRIVMESSKDKNKAIEELNDLFGSENIERI